MTTHLPWMLLGLAVSATALAGQEPGRDDKKPVPLYTDDDLRRVSPLRDQTGGGMSRAPAAETPPLPARPRPGRGEEYWRRETERLRARLQPLRDRAEQLRQCMEERRTPRRGGLSADPRVESCRRRLSALTERIRDEEDRLAERARRQGALPGWLR